MKLWIARDKDGTLCLFRNKPILDVYYWFDNSLEMTGCVAELLKTDFPEVTFENSPREIELKLIEIFTEPKNEGFLPTETLKRINGLKNKK